MKLTFTFLLLSNFFLISAFSQNVLVLWDDSPSNPNTVSLVNALNAVGFNVTLSSVSETAWNNTNPSLTGFNAVIHINGTTFATGMPAAGQAALVNYVQNNGGKYVQFEWNAYEVDETNTMAAMSDLTLFVRNNSGFPASRTLDVVPAQAGHPIMSGVSAQFDIVGCLEIGGIRNFATQPSTVLMTHNGYNAIATREFGNGKILGFAFAPNWDANSTDLTNNQVQLMIINFIGFCSAVSGTDTQSACDSFDWIDGNTYTSSNNSATWTLTNAAGCDSTVTLNLTITNSNTESEIVTECDSYFWSTNGQTYNQSGQYIEVLSNQNGCDSTVTLNLTLNSSNTGSETVTECDSYTWSANGQTYTQSGQYTEVLSNIYGCDSTVILNLTIETIGITTQPVDQNVFVGNNSQFSVVTSAINPTYQWQINQGLGWLDLFNAGQFSGVNTDVLTVSNVTLGQNNTLFRCIVTGNSNCSDITDEALLTVEDNTGIEELNQLISIYPNPTSGYITISSENTINSSFKLIDIQGKVVLNGKIESTEQTIDISNLSKGQYNLIFEDERIQVLSVIKH